VEEVIAMEKLAAIDADVLAELSNVGANAAAASLGQLLGKNAEIVVPKVGLVRVQDVKGTLAEQEEVVGAAYVNIFRKNSAVLLMFPRKDAIALSDFMLMRKKSASDGDFDEMGRSAFNEMGNIVAASYITAIANFLKTRIDEGIPHSTIDMAGSILDAAIVMIASESDRVLVTNADFTLGGKKLHATIYFLFEPPVVKELLKKAGKMGAR